MAKHLRGVLSRFVRKGESLLEMAGDRPVTVSHCHHPQLAADRPSVSHGDSVQLGHPPRSLHLGPKVLLQ